MGFMPLTAPFFTIVFNFVYKFSIVMNVYMTTCVIVIQQLNVDLISLTFIQLMGLSRLCVMNVKCSSFRTLVFDPP